MTINLAILAAGAAALLAASAPADAAIVTYTFTGFNLGGNYDDDYDHLGLFGLPANLDGRGFSLVFRLDTTLGISTSYSDPTSSSSGHTYIRPNFSDPNDPHDTAHTPPVKATLTIDGHSYQFDGYFSPSNSYVSTPSSAVGIATSGYYTDLTLVTRNGPDIDATVDILARSIDHVIPLGFDQDYTIDFTQGAGRDPAFYTNGNFTIRTNSNAQYAYSHSALRADRLVVTVSNGIAGGVPEPASWAMLMSGFGLVGSAARRRRAVLQQPIRV
jgi:hypothetical protein